MTVTPERIREARKAKRLTQQELADKLNIPRSSYAIKEKTGDFTKAEIESLTKCLEILEESEGNNDNKKPVEDDLQARFISRLDDDLREMKARQLLLEKMLLELKESLLIAHTRQKASFAVTYFLAEELAAVPKDEGNRAKLVRETRKKIESRLKEVTPGDK